MAYLPFMDSVTLTTATTRYQLSALVKAIDPSPTLKRCSGVRLEFDITSTGRVRVGNSNVSATHCGWTLVPTQDANVASIQASPGGVLNTDDIWLVGDTNSQQINVTLIPVGT